MFNLYIKVDKFQILHSKCVHKNVCKWQICIYKQLSVDDSLGDKIVSINLFKFQY